MTPSILQFADGFPEWACAGAPRRAHVHRVVRLVDAWAGELGWEDRERARLRAAGWLHDALRDAPGAELRGTLEPRLRDLPDKLLHGPAAAARLREDGFDDEEVLNAVAFHTIGHPDLGMIGRLLYLADYLEPGRRFDPVGRAALRARMPRDVRGVLEAVVRSRVHHLLNSSNPIRPETMGYWNSIVAPAPARP